MNAAETEIHIALQAQAALERARASSGAGPAAAAKRGKTSAEAQGCLKAHILAMPRTADRADALASYREAERLWWDLALSAKQLGKHIGKSASAWKSADVADATQEALLGLFEAARRFDPSKGYRFGTYARWWARNAVRRHLFRSTSPATRPMGLETANANVHRPEFADCSSEEIAARTGHRLDHVEAVRGGQPIWFDATVNMTQEGGGKMRIGDMILAHDPREVLIRSIDLRRALERLSSEEQSVFDMHRRGYVSAEIGPALGIEAEDCPGIQSTAVARIAMERGTTEAVGGSVDVMRSVHDRVVAWLRAHADTTRVEVAEGIGENRWRVQEVLLLGEKAGTFTRTADRRGSLWQYVPARPERPTVGLVVEAVAAGITTSSRIANRLQTTQFCARRLLRKAVSDGRLVLVPHVGYRLPARSAP